MLHTHKPMTEEALTAMRARNLIRASICIRVLGSKHITSVENRIQRKDARPFDARLLAIGIGRLALVQAEVLSD
jgi:hypothetical protein